MFLKGLNLSDLAIKTKVSTTYLSQIINGKKIPSPKLAKKIANVLDLNIEDLFEFAKLKLKSNRSLFMINRCERLVDLLSISRKHNMEAKRIRFVQSRIYDKPNLVMIQFVKNQKPFLTFEKNLIIYNGEDYTEEVMNIYGITKV